MDSMNQPQTGQTAPGHQSVQPQPGGFYQFQPGVGFVQVSGPQTATGQAQGAAPGSEAGMGQQPAADGTDSQSGMFGPGTPDGAQPKFDQNKLGKMYTTVNDVMNGDADPASLMGLFTENSGDFWKGALVGAAAVVLLNNDAVKGAVGGLAASVKNMFGEPDPAGEQVTVGGK